MNRSHHKDEYENLLLTVSSQSPQKITLDLIVNTLKKHSVKVDLKRLNESAEMMEAAFIVEVSEL